MGVIGKGHVEMGKKAETGGPVGAADQSKAGTVRPEAGAATIAAAEDRRVVRLKDLVERVSAETGEKKQIVRPVVAATLAAIDAALAAGEELNIPPLGRLRIQRSKDTPRGRSMMLRLKQGSGGGNSADPLAAVDEES